MASSIASWQPQHEWVNNVVALIKTSVTASTTAENQMAQDRLADLSRHPEFPMYLGYILVNMNVSDQHARMMAGILLKNEIKRTLVAQTMPIETLVYVRASLLRTLGDADPRVRATAGTGVATLLMASSHSTWPEFAPAIMEGLSSHDLNRVHGSVGAVTKAVEDAYSNLFKPEISSLVPRLIELSGTSPMAEVRARCLDAILQLLIHMPASLKSNIEAFLHVLFQLSEHDHDVEVKKRILSSLVLMVELQLSVLMPYMPSIVQYMLAMSNDNDVDLAIEATEFWITCCDGPGGSEFPMFVQPLLPALVPVLLKNMMYSDDELMILDTDDSNENEPDNDSDIKPHFHNSRSALTGHSSAADDDNDDDYDDDDDADDPVDYSGEWTLRKCSAASLDALSTAFENDILPFVLPVVQQMLASSDWKHREAAILAIGAVSTGCLEGMQSYLSQLLPYLVQQLGDSTALVRSITCWTLGRYSLWACTDSNPKLYFEPMLAGILPRVLDGNKEVQKAACSAVSTILDAADKDIEPYMHHFINAFIVAIRKYQRRNFSVLLDCIVTFIERVGDAIQHAGGINELTPLIVETLQQTPSDSRDIIGILEVLTALSSNLKLDFQPYAPLIFQRCILIIENAVVTDQRVRQVTAVSTATWNIEPPDMEIVVVAVDMISGMTEGLGASMESLVAMSSLFQHIVHCLQQFSADMHQSAFALVGDLYKSGCHASGNSTLVPIVQLIGQNMDPKTQVRQGVVNNAVWALGEIVNRVGISAVLSMVPALLQQLVYILKDAGTYHSSLIGSCAVTLGIFCVHATDVVAPHVQTFIIPWCEALASAVHPSEMAISYSGLCRVIEANPSGVLSAFSSVVMAIVAYENPPSTVATGLRTVLLSFKSNFGSHWPSYFYQFPENVRTQLQSMYHLE